MNSRMVAYATTAMLLFAMPVNAQVPVEDAHANANLAAIISNALEQLKAVESTVKNTADAVQLETVAQAIGGNPISPELQELFAQMKDTYFKTMSTYNSVMAVPGNFEQDMQVFLPPPGGWESMTLPQALARIEAIKNKTDGTQLAVSTNNILRDVERAASADALSRIELMRKASWKMSRDQQLRINGELAAIQSAALLRMEKTQAEQYALQNARDNERMQQINSERAMREREANEVVTGATARMGLKPKSEYGTFGK